ncbi:MAG TPA: DegT/DnrJ/EryC1/StrS family aminotransferase, partial [Gemmatimonadales bacterium]|nr:DegT/DnrJ/EryC1/StrS family aminotransferase [Gemmatimonadales bacterium]
GMMLTQDDALAEHLKKMRLHGGSRQYFHDFVGTNSRIDTLQAAVLLAKLPFLERWSTARRARALAYSARFAEQTAVTAPYIDPANEHIFHQYTIRAPRRDALLEHLKSRGIGCAVYYPLALHLQPCFSHLGYRRGSLPVTEAATAEVLSLPVYPELRDEQMDAVVNAVNEFYD